MSKFYKCLLLLELPGEESPPRPWRHWTVSSEPTVNHNYESCSCCPVGNVWKGTLLSRSAPHHPGPKGHFCDQFFAEAWTPKDSLRQNSEVGGFVLLVSLP